MTPVIEVVGNEGPIGTLDDVVRAYQQWMEVKAKEHCAGFKQRLNDDAEAARAEAAVFVLCRALELKPFPNEDPSTGGADFLCTGAKQPLVVEATIVRAESAEEKSKLPARMSLEDSQARVFNQITGLLRGRATAKAGQLSNQEGARVLAICLQHDSSDLLMGAYAAKCLMSGKPNITVPLDGSQAYSGTRLEESAFFRFVKGTDQVEPCRRSISTILLVELRESIMSVIALHHPDPVVRLEPEVLFPIPSLVVTNWPLKVGDTIQTEWRVPPKEPEPHRFAYQPPWLSEEDLRTDVSALL